MSLFFEQAFQLMSFGFEMIQVERKPWCWVRKCVKVLKVDVIVGIVFIRGERLWMDGGSYIAEEKISGSLIFLNVMSRGVRVLEAIIFTSKEINMRSERGTEWLCSEWTWHQTTNQIQNMTFRRSGECDGWSPELFRHEVESLERRGELSSASDELSRDLHPLSELWGWQM